MRSSRIVSSLPPVVPRRDRARAERRCGNHNKADVIRSVRIAFHKEAYLVNIGKRAQVRELIYGIAERRTRILANWSSRKRWRGVALAALVMMAEAWARKCGLELVVLETGAGNLSARAFYDPVGLRRLATPLRRRWRPRPGGHAPSRTEPPVS